MIAAIRYAILRWWFKRQIVLCHYRREELRQIMRRELDLIDWQEHDYNARLRELQSRELHSRIGEVRA